MSSRLPEHESELERALRAARTPFTRGNAVEIHRVGSTGLDAMLAAVSGARRSIDLETYILRADATGRRFFRALAERARNGVAVRFLYDDFGARGIRRRVLKPLRDAGVEVAVFNPLRRRARGLALRHRDHRKILIVDGEVGFTGGLNLADECYDGTRHKGRALAPWRDVHVAVRGPAVRALDRVFRECWALAGGKARAPAATPAGDAGDERLAVLPDGPSCEQGRLREVLCAALATAEERAVLVSPYFLPGPEVAAAMAAAVRRGVRVEVLVAGYNDHPVVASAVRALHPRFLDDGVNLFEYEQGLMHAKLAVFDGYWAIVGTSNFDQQSFHHSYEVNLLARGGTLPQHLDEVVAADLRDAQQVTHEGLARRSRLARLRDRAAASFVVRL